MTVHHPKKDNTLFCITPVAYYAGPAASTVGRRCINAIGAYKWFGFAGMRAIIMIMTHIMYIDS